MACYALKLRSNTDVCHHAFSTEKDCGVQSLILRETSNIKSVTVQHVGVAKTLFENRLGYSPKDLVFIQVSQPTKKFEHFDSEKQKIVITVDAYFRLLEFFKNEWPVMLKRIDSDFEELKSKQEWKKYSSSISYRGLGDISFTLPLDATKTFALELSIVKDTDTGKMVIMLAYTDSLLGNCPLPLLPMLQLSQDLACLKTLYKHREGMPIKKKRLC